MLLGFIFGIIIVSIPYMGKEAFSKTVPISARIFTQFQFPIWVRKII